MTAIGEDSTGGAGRRSVRKIALLSMDVEEWYHLDYFAAASAQPPSMLDGLSRFADLLASEGGLPATLFVVGDLLPRLGPRLRALAELGLEVASHGPDHTHLSRVSRAAFVEGLRGAKDALENAVGRRVVGYRAPCFSMTEAGLAELPALGFEYDSSWVQFESHPLYGKMDLRNWTPLQPRVWKSPTSDFVEFEIPTLDIGSVHVPVAGGGWFRLLPWLGMRSMLRRYLRRGDTYVLFVHPFEFSSEQMAEYPDGTPWSTRQRFEVGRSRMHDRVREVISLLRNEGYEFLTFTEARAALLAEAAL